MTYETNEEAKDQEKMHIVREKSEWAMLYLYSLVQLLGCRN